MKVPLPQAIFFDLDDTILDFSSGVESCWDTACGAFASELGATAPEELAAAIHRYRAWFWSDPERHRRGRLDLRVARREIVTGALLELGLELPQVADGIAGAYIAARDAGLQLFPDSVVTLEHLRSRSVRLALLTNGRAEEQRAKIERFGLAPFFDCIVVEGEFGIGKPDERVYRHALAEVRSEAAATWMVGDNLEWDVAAPQRLGLLGIWYDVTGAGLPPGSLVRPDRTVRSLAELMDGA
jgi:putative hydrolase of the HAD superfamily